MSQHTHSSTLRVALVGGDGRSSPTSLPAGVRVRHYGSHRDVGNGGHRRLRSALRANSIDAVVLHARFIGHDLAVAVRRLCRARRIPVVTVMQGREAVRCAIECLHGEVLGAC